MFFTLKINLTWSKHSLSVQNPSYGLRVMLTKNWSPPLSTPLDPPMLRRIASPEHCNHSGEDGGSKENMAGVWDLKLEPAEGKNEQ